jgi:uroporphyrinogen-III synthase
MKSKVVAILETRTGARLAELISRRGGIALSAPALEEVPDIEPHAIASLIERWRVTPYDFVIFQTGVGTGALFAAADSAGLTSDLQALVAGVRVVVRGPKPIAALTARQVRIDIRAASPFTSETVLEALAASEMSGCNVLVQRYGAANKHLADELVARGARVEEIATYRWALPADVRPLLGLLDALQAGRVDAVVFTSAVQMHNLFTVAERNGRAPVLAEMLNRTLVASIGPVCSRVLKHYGVTPALEADPPKLGPLLNALDSAFGNV